MTWLTFFERPENPGRCEFGKAGRHAMFNGAPVRITARSEIVEGDFVSISVQSTSGGGMALLGMELALDRSVPLLLRSFRGEHIERIEVQT